MTLQPIKELKNRPHFFLITGDDALTAVCRQAQSKSAVALDTEFIRTRSYYPKLGLVQLYDGEQVSLIVPDLITDFTPLIELLADQTVVKVLHACYEDLEVFQYHFGQLPTPLLDTQVIAAFLGFSHSTGLATLIQHYFKLELDKGAARTDWLARPLSDKQLNYAAADVWYLLPLYRRMQTDLQQTRWKSAVEFDCEMLLAKPLEVKRADEAYLNIPNAWKLSPPELMRLKLLAKWRQEEAIKRDLALNFVVKSESLWLAAKYNPKHTSELLELGIHPQEVRVHGKKILQLAAQAARYQETDYPPPIDKLSDDPRYKSTIKALQDKLQQLTPPDLSPSVIAGRRSLESLMRWVWLKQQDPTNPPELMRGWRREFGQALINTMQMQ